MGTSVSPWSGASAEVKTLELASTDASAASAAASTAADGKP
jgi:hypothetical protein